MRFSDASCSARGTAAPALLSLPFPLDFRHHQHQLQFNATLTIHCTHQNEAENLSFLPLYSLCSFSAARFGRVLTGLDQLKTYDMT